MMLAGYVCLIGAGPGDPGLLTRRGLAYLKRADVVLYDHLAPPQLRLEGKAGCQWIAVGKEGGKPSWNQTAINQLLIDEARAGKFVVRLKGGDGFLFGRGGEEAEALVAAGIRYLFVPGVSASLSVPAGAGIPVTHRHFAHGVVVRSGHLSAQETIPRYTQVALMALATLPAVVEELLAQGYPETTPAAVISRGTTPFQRVVPGTLATIADLTQQAALTTPALLVAGEAVNLASRLTWRGNLPLTGKRILWTRPVQDREKPYLEELELLGAEVIRLPLFEVHPVSKEDFLKMIPEIVAHAWIVLTSQNAVKIFCDHLLAIGKDWRYLVKNRMAVIGAQTEAALTARGRIPDLTAAAENSRGLLNALLERLTPGDEVALCRASRTLPTLAAGLDKAGVPLRQFSLYHLKCPAYENALIDRLFEEPFDLVVLTAPSAVRHYFKLLHGRGLSPRETTRYACLGPETAAQLENAGHSAWIVPERPNLDELVKKVVVKWGGEADVSQHPDA